MPTLKAHGPGEPERLVYISLKAIMRDADMLLSRGWLTVHMWGIFREADIFLL